MANTYKTTNATDSGSVNAEIYTSLALGLGRLRGDLVLGNLVENYSEVAREKNGRFGATIQVPKRGTVTATNKTPGSAVTPAASTSTHADVSLNKHKTWDILVEDYGSLFTGPTLLTGYMEDGAGAIAEAAETDLIGLYTDAGLIIGAPSAGASWTLVRTIRKQSRKNKWRANQPSYIVWGPEAEEDLFGEVQWNQANTSPDNALVTADLGVRLKFRHFSSNLAPSIAGSPGAEHGLAFQREGIGIAFIPASLLGLQELPAGLQPQSVIMEAMDYNDDQGNAAYTLRMIVGYDQKERGTMLTVDSIYGCGVIRSELVFDILV